MTSRTLVILALALTTGCATKVIEKGVIDGRPPPPPPPPNDEYRSTMNGYTRGHLSVQGAVFEGTYAESETSEPNMALTVAGGATGTEGERSCGDRWETSQSRATARFTPQTDLGLRVFGFALNGTATARDGLWRGSVTFICRGSYYPNANAQADAHGAIEFTYEGMPGEISDHLLVRSSGPDVGALSINANGPTGKLPLRPLDNRLQLLEVTAPGPYQIEAHLVASKSDGCNGHNLHQCSIERAAAVTVQSYRDALTLRYGHPVTEAGLIPLSLAVTTDLMEQEIEAQLFGPTGKYFPCREGGQADGTPLDGDCGKHAKDLYLENLQLRTEGGWIIIDAGLRGNGSLWVLRPGVRAELMLAAVPAFVEDSLVLSSVQVVTESENMIFNYLSGRYIQNLVDRISSTARYSLTDLQKQAIDKIAEQFPVTITDDGGESRACIGLNVRDVRFRGLEVLGDPDRILLHLGLSTTPLTGDRCVKDPEQ